VVPDTMPDAARLFGRDIGHLRRRKSSKEPVGRVRQWTDAHPLARVPQTR